MTDVSRKVVPDKGEPEERTRTLASVTKALKFPSCTRKKKNDDDEEDELVVVGSWICTSSMVLCDPRMKNGRTKRRRSQRNQEKNRKKLGAKRGHSMRESLTYYFTFTLP